MKKQLIILLAAVSLLALAQSPQRFPGGVIGKYFQKSGSSADSVLLGNGQAKALSTIQANVDTVHKIATKYDASKKLDITDTSAFVRKSGTQTITGQKTFSSGLIANGIESSAGGLFYGQTTPFPTGLGTYVANYVSPTYGARILAYNGTDYQDLKLGKLISGSNFQLHLNADGTSVFNGTLTAANLSGPNTGDETLTTIKTKLGAATGSSDGYLKYQDWNTFNNKQNALGFTPENSANKGSANGYVPLGSDSKIATTYLPDAIVGSMKYKGTLDATGGSYPGNSAKGDYYVISTAGTIGSISYLVGDWAAYNGTTWDAIQQGHNVSSVFGRTGAIIATTGDYTSDQVTEGTTNKYYTDTRARSAISLTTTGNSGAATYSSGIFNVPNYTLTGLNGIKQVTLTSGINGTHTTSTVTTDPVTGSTYALGITTDAGYTMPTTTQLGNAATAYNWGNHATAGYATQSWVGNNFYVHRNFGNENINLNLIKASWGATSRGDFSTQLNTPTTYGIYASLADDINQGLQIYGSNFGSGGGNDLYFRVKSTPTVDFSTDWTSWKKVLDSSNFGSYALSLTGGTVSGTIVTTNLAITGSSPSSGKVLTATDASGNCTWQTPGYASGTYTPTFSNLSNVTSISPGLAVYTKINHIVHVSIQCSITATSAAGVSFSVTLPFGLSSDAAAVNGQGFIASGNTLWCNVGNYTNGTAAMNGIAGNTSNNLAIFTLDYITPN